MATAQVGAVLRHIRNLAADQAMSEQTDGALLRAFLSRNDQAAFAALLRRHGPMVLRVCRRALGNAQDAEDALQASFLVLARQAASIRKKESLASWLHGVAYRMATHAQRAAARRHKHESRAHPTPLQDPALSAAWQELQVLLDEEIERLPETLREPFVACCLENKSGAEVAQQLCLEEATVRKRLSRARKLLQERLTRRGVSLTTVLAAAAVGGHDALAAVPRCLVAPTVKAAAQITAGQALTGGPVSAKVLTLAEGVNQAMLLTKCKTAMLLFLATALVGAGLGLAVLRSPGAEPSPRAQQAPPETASQESNKGRQQPANAPAPARDVDIANVRGRVLDPNGLPFAGAKLYVGYDHPKKRTYPLRPTASSGDDGRFEFTFAEAKPDQADVDASPPQVMVMAVAEGHGCGWANVGPAAEELTLPLVKDVPVSGRILDPDGRPVAGAKLTVTGVAPTAPNRGVFADTVPHGGDLRDTFAGGWAGPLPGKPTVLTTAADGRFRLAGVGRGRVVSLHLEAAGIASTDLGVTADAANEHVASATRPIRGVVRDQATGKPLPGVTVFLNFWIDPKYEVPRWAKAVTDKEGRYELLGLAKSARYDLAVRPAAGQLYFQRQVSIQDTAGLDPLTADIEMVQALIVRGTVTDKATSKPIAQAVVDYHALYANPNVIKLAGFWTPRAEASTGPDGSYALTVLPGQGVIGVVGPKPDAYMTALVTLQERKDFFKVPLVWDNNEGYLTPAAGGNAAGAPLLQDDYNALVLLEPGVKEKTLVKDVVLERPLERKGRVVGPDDQPIAGITVSGLLPRWYVVETLKGAEFTVRGLNPRGNRQLIFHHKDKNLGFFLKALPDGKSGPLTIKLQSCGSVSGRIVDQDGQPVAGVRIPGHLGNCSEITTDKEGRFHAEGLVPGVAYTIMRPKVVATVLVQVVAEPGKNKDLGDLKVDN